MFLFVESVNEDWKYSWNRLNIKNLVSKNSSRKPFNSCVLQVKRNKAFPSALSYLSQDTSLKQDAILFSLFVLSFRPLFNWMGKEDTSSHYLLYQTLFSVLFSTRKSPKTTAHEGTHESHLKNRETRFFIIQISKPKCSLSV